MPDRHEYFEMDFPSPSNAHWIPWLQQKFLRSGVLCQTLEMPAPYNPVYSAWAQTFSQAHLNENSVLVAHSAGAGFILKWLHEHQDAKLSKLVLIAPWRDPARRFDDFALCDLAPTLSDRIGEIHIFYSSDETVEGVKQSVEEIMNAYPNAKLHSYADKGHFCLNDLGNRYNFDDLWTICA